MQCVTMIFNYSGGAATALCFSSLNMVVDVAPSLHFIVPPSSIVLPSAGVTD
jgi:hypothetical protein